MLDEELENLINSETKEEENNSLSKLDDFLKNPMNNIDNIEVPKKPIDNNQIEEYENRIKELEKELEKNKEKIEKIKTMLDA